MLEELDDGVWVAAMPLSFMGLRIGTRMTVVRRSTGDLWVHSPIAWTEELAKEIDALGRVTDVVAPSLYHHRFAAEWQAARPDAVFHGPAALAKKRKDLQLNRTLEEAPSADWASELAPFHIDGALLDETAFVHRKTRTLIGADLTENFTTSPHWPTRLYLKANGIHGKIGWGRALRLVYRDKPAAKRSVQALLEQDFDRVVIAHGDVIPTEGKAAIRQTFEFLG